MLVFLRARWVSWLLAGGCWASGGLLLLVGPLDVPWSNAGRAFYAGVDYASIALVAVGLLVIRTTRSLLVGFVPLVGLWLGLSFVLAVFLHAVGINLKWTIASTAAGLLAAVLGIALGVREIRRGVRVRFVATLLAIGAVAAVQRLHSAGRDVRVRYGHRRARLAHTGCMATLPAVPATEDAGQTARRGVALEFLLARAHGTVAAVRHLRTPSLPLVLVPITAYAFVLVFLLRGKRRRMSQTSAKRMLLLRVFSRTALRSGLLDLLDDSWRRVGRIDLVVGVDLAIRTLSAAALANVLLGRTHHQFVRTASDVQQRLSVLPSGPAFDWRYPLNELHCLPDVWQRVVSRLARDADVVLMDLRGFQEANRGAAYELSLLLQEVPLGRVVLLTDRNTDEPALTEVLCRAWSQVAADSPNARLTEPRIELLRCSGRASVDARAVLCRVFVAAYSRVNDRASLYGFQRLLADTGRWIDSRRRANSSARRSPQPINIATIAWSRSSRGCRWRCTIEYRTASLIDNRIPQEDVQAEGHVVR